MFWRRRNSVFEQPRQEPLFRVTREDDPDMQRAHARAADTVDELLAHLEREGRGTSAVKMRFRDPDQSERLGEDRFAFIWLLVVQHERPTRRFAVEFFELPPEFQKWHQVGERLIIEHDQIFDWFVNDDGLMHGGFTLRVARARLPEGDRAAFDRYTGVRQWADATRS
ncbi:MAG TPA: DUF2314 domain-containing protein [Burkholderiaceae bacterium]